MAFSNVFYSTNEYPIDQFVAILHPVDKLLEFDLTTDKIQVYAEY